VNQHGRYGTAGRPSDKGNRLSGRLIAIGDIHGCDIAFDLLLRQINPSADDITIALGDYIDRGPNSKGVVNRLIQLSQVTSLVPLLGNHEEMMLAVLQGEREHADWLRFGGVETLESYGFQGDRDFLPPEHAQFFGELLNYYETDDFFFTHAAYDPQLPLEEQPAELLRWHSLRDGMPEPHQNGKTAVVGHTANRSGQIVRTDHLICLDTYCYGGGWLTAMDLRTGQTWQANQAGELRR